MSRKAKSKNNIVKLTLDLANPPPLTIEQKNRLSALSALSDDQIDTSDAPHLPDAVWMKPADLPHTAWDAFFAIDGSVPSNFLSEDERAQGQHRDLLDDVPLK